MHSKKQAMDAYQTGPLHQQRGGLCRRRYDKRGIGLYNPVASHRRSLALAHVYTEEDRCLGRFRNGTLVRLPTAVVREQKGP